ncbi:TetR family transcriptional regulator [Burkholderia sp. WAC0059]|nr:TetR family transcriptional regulator [Burkholderia sp. WAC0059]
MLHALEPIGTGTPDIESLRSYFCRLAVSHAVSAAALARRVMQEVGWQFSEKRDWHLFNLNGMGESAANWSAALSALTSVARLDRLTLLPWREVIAQSGLAATASRWCPLCLAEDRDSGRTPYFRLAWDVGAVTVCARHRISLVHVCPDCCRTDARHNASCVVPGWCAHCGAFLGNVDPLTPATPEEMWKTAQIGNMLTTQAMLDSPPHAATLHDTINELVTRLDNGKSAVFARRIGLGKATVHHWLREGGVPTLSALLHIASQAGLPLPNLLTGNLADWPPASIDIPQLMLLFPESRRRAPPRMHDWEQVRAELTAMSHLPGIISVLEAARRLDIDPRLLYQHANREARVLAQRWTQYMARRAQQSRGKAATAIEDASRDIVSDGKAINMREIRERVAPEVLGSVRKVIHLVQDARDRTS